MGYINIFVSSYCKLSLDSSGLILSGEKEARFAIEDINCVMIDNLQCSVSISLLSRLAKEGVAVFVCDQKHIPTAILMPYGQYFAHLRVYRLQTQVKKPLVKQMWQSIVSRKIANQAECLRLEGKSVGADKLFALSQTVLSDDTSNLEATAARIYFKELFGKDFDRRSDNGINACLNYGYAIVRGLIARTLAARGFSAFLGIHHASELNAFNLADDFIEPYRAIVDRTVSKFSLSTLDSDAKKLLFNLNNTDVSIDNANQVLPRSIEICIDSYMTSLEQGVNKLKLPIMQEIKSHEYL